MKIFFLLFAIVLSSCGASDDEAVDLAIETAMFHLSTGACQSAIEELEDIGRQNKNARYLKLLASSYACRAGYNTTTFVTSDLLKFVTPAPMGGVSTFSTSTSMDDPQNQSYLDLQKAIDILLYAGGLDKDVDPTMDRRELVFGSQDGGDINALIMYMTMAQLGKYFYFYGNAALGVKGDGSVSGGNSCFIDYDNLAFAAPVGGATDVDDILLVYAAASNACVTRTAGSLYLGADTASLNVERICQGVVLFNNLWHVLPSVVAAIGGDSFSDVSALTASIDTLKDNMLTASPSSVEISNVLSQEKCETLTASDQDPLQFFMLFVMEPMIL